MTRLKQVLQNNYMFIIVFTICLLFLVYKIHIGYVYNDEPYILSVGHRLYLGEALIVDEWHPAQLNGLFVYPFMVIFKMLFGSDNTGIILFFRYCFLFIWSFIALFSYLKLSKLCSNKFILTLSIMYFYLFASMDQMTLSYNMWSLGSLILISVLLVSESTKYTYYCVGFLLSIAVIVCPYLLILYLCYFLFVLFTNFFRKDILRKYEMFKWTNFFKLSTVCVFLCVMLFLYLVGDNSLSELFSNVQYVIADPSYTKYSIFEKTLRYITTLLVTFKFLIVYSILVLALSLVDKQRKLLYFIFLCFGCVYSMVSIMINLELTWFNQMMFPVVILGLFSMIHLGVESSKMRVVYIMGLIFSFCVYMTSDTEIIATCFGLSLSGFSSFILINEFLDFTGKKNIKKNLVILIHVVLSFQIICVGYSRYSRTYFDKDITILNSRIEEGPGKFIYTSQENKEEYSVIYSDFMSYKNIDVYDESDSIAILSMNPWLYLSTDLKYCIFSSWTYSDSKLRLDKFKQYLKVTRKKPKLIYFLKTDYQLTDMNFILEERDYDIMETDLSYMLKESETNYEDRFDLH